MKELNTKQGNIITAQYQKQTRKRRYNKLGIIQLLHSASRREGGYRFLLPGLTEIALRSITSLQSSKTGVT